MLTLAMGGGAARLISLASVPVLTRLYSPSDYGVLSLFSSLVVLLLPLMTLRYGIAVPLPRRDETAMNLFALAMLLSLASAALFFLLLGIFVDAFIPLLSLQDIAQWWWLIVLGAFAASAMDLFGMWAARRRQYQVMARTQVMQTIVGEATKVFLGLSGLRPLGLLVGQLVNQGGGAIALAAQFGRDFRRYWGSVSVRNMKRLAVFYADLPLYRLPAQLMLVASIQAPILLSGMFYDADSVGFLGLTIMVISLPVSLLAGSMGRAYYAEAAQMASRPQALYALTRHVLTRMALLGLVPAYILLFFSEPLFAIAFGAQWRLSGEYAAIMSLFFVMQFVSQPIVQVLTVIRKNSYFLLFSSTRLVLVLIAFGIPGRTGLPLSDAVVLYSLLLSVQRLVELGLVFVLLDREKARRASMNP